MTDRLTVSAAIRELKEKCAFIRENLLYKKVVTEEDVAAYWPGGEENHGTDLQGWIFCYANYVRFCDRLDSGYAGNTSAADEADRAILEALSDQPVTVELPPLNGDAEPRRVSVYPKSFVALDWLDKRDRHIAWLVEQRKKLLALPSAVSADALEAVGVETSYQYGLIISAVVHPGPELPFDPENLPRETPAWISKLSPVAILRIYEAFVQGNIVRLHSLYVLLKEKDETNHERPSWRTFFATRSEDSSIPTAVLMRNRSLQGQIATAIVAAEARERAVEEAKQQEQQKEHV